MLERWIVDTFALHPSGGSQFGLSPCLQSIFFERSQRSWSMSYVIPWPHLIKICFSSMASNQRRALTKTRRRHFHCMCNIWNKRRSDAERVDIYFSQSVGCGQRPSFGQINLKVKPRTSTSISKWVVLHSTSDEEQSSYLASTEDMAEWKFDRPSSCSIVAFGSFSLVLVVLLVQRSRRSSTSCQMKNEKVTLIIGLLIDVDRLREKCRWSTDECQWYPINVRRPT